MHRATARFWKCLNGLPEPIQRTAQQRFNILKENPDHSSLEFKKIGRLWSVRAGFNHRALAVEDGEDYVWIWIGTHDAYERLIRDNR